jgi:hypothetical protein
MESRVQVQYNIFAQLLCYYSCWLYTPLASFVRFEYHDKNLFLSQIWNRQWTQQFLELMVDCIQLITVIFLNSMCFAIDTRDYIEHYSICLCKKKHKNVLFHFDWPRRFGDEMHVESLWRCSTSLRYSTSSCSASYFRICLWCTWFEK